MAKCYTCQAEWSGLAMAHCRVCHRTFATTKLFDKHRRHYTCMHPASIELIEDDRGIWRAA